MEKVYQSVSSDGLKVPMVLMRQYGLGPGATVALELERDGIRIVPTRAEPSAIENAALCYLLSHVGDAVTVSAHLLPDQSAWEVDVYGVGMTQSSGKLVYSLSGMLVTEQSTPLAQIRNALIKKAP
jgi:antitoxin component of MazEF toxin-antitoxin module